MFREGLAPQHAGVDVFGMFPLQFLEPGPVSDEDTLEIRDAPTDFPEGLNHEGQVFLGRDAPDVETDQRPRPGSPGLAQDERAPLRIEAFRVDALGEKLEILESARIELLDDVP